jgi:WbqC-like protein family protein
MILGVMQPYFMPYIGYFQLMKAVDKYVVYDDVNYIKGGWVNRNYVLINGEKEMFTVTLQKASQNKLFNEIMIGDNFNKLMKTLQINYSKAINFDQTMTLMERIISFSDKRLAIFIANSFREIVSYLSIDTEILMSSDIPKDNSLRGKDKIMQICEILDADTYYNAIGGQNLYDKEEFREHGVALNFVSTISTPYIQLHTKEFVPHLSMIDVLMNNTKDEVIRLLESYQIKC